MAPRIGKEPNNIESSMEETAEDDAIQFITQLVEAASKTGYSLQQIATNCAGWSSYNQFLI